MISIAEAGRHVTVLTSPSAREVSPARAGLSIQEEHELAARISAGDREARNRMVQANLGLAGKIAREFRGRGLAYEDLVAEGNLGLIRAAEEFDPRFGTRFSTYAAFWIKEAIRRALMNTTSTIRVPAHMVGLLTKWRRAERALTREAGRAATFDEIASSMQLSEAQKIQVIRALDAGRLRLESSYGDRAGDHLFGEITDRYGRADEQAEGEDERDALWRLLGRLDARERTILMLRFGLEGEVLTLREIGRRLGVTREWVRKIEIRALRKVRNDRSDRASDAKVPSRPAPRKCRTRVSRTSQVVPLQQQLQRSHALPNASSSTGGEEVAGSSVRGRKRILGPLPED